MKAREKVVYVPPVYEEIQHEVTSVDENNNPLRTSFHTDSLNIRNTTILKISVNLRINT